MRYLFLNLYGNMFVIQFICDFSRLHEGLHEKLTLEGSQKSPHRFISSCHRCLCIVRTNVFMLYKTIFLC